MFGTFIFLLLLAFEIDFSFIETNCTFSRSLVWFKSVSIDSGMMNSLGLTCRFRFSGGFLLPVVAVVVGSGKNLDGTAEGLSLV